MSASSYSIEYFDCFVSKTLIRWCKTMENSVPEYGHSSRGVRPSREINRRVSNMDVDINGNTTNLSTTGSNERDLHWKTILGYPPHSTSSSISASASFQILPKASESKRTAPGPLRSSQSRNMHTPQFSRVSPSHTQLDFEKQPRVPRVQPPKPFACDLCLKRFERRGHLKVRYFAYLSKSALKFYTVF